MKLKRILLFTLALVVFSGFRWVLAEDADDADNVAWNTPIKKFSALKGSLTKVNAGTTEAQAVDYLLMHFHGVSPDERPQDGKTVYEKTRDNDAHYVFYDGRYQLAVTPVAAKDIDKTRKDLAAKGPQKEGKTYTAYTEYLGEQGWLMTQFHYQQYSYEPGTRLYLVTSYKFLEDTGFETGSDDDGVVVHGSGPETDRKAFLISVSEDYFKSPNNAWVDYQNRPKEKVRSVVSTD